MANAREVTNELAAQMRKLLAAEEGTFTVGGSIPVATSREKASAAETTTCAPIVIRWDPPTASPGESRNVGFPKPARASLKALLEDAQPATFGRGNKDVLDETYRKATKLDASALSTDFCPYSVGIIDIVGALLMPSERLTGKSVGIKAELYKLNVYSGPSGHFKAHVDTPRSEDQFGSLVVCLPYKHSGGGLVLRHQEQEVTYDWAPASVNPFIQWAAFFSDVEHEVLEVTAGHRITLTYNLYVCPSPSDLDDDAEMNENLDLFHLPLFKAIKSSFDNPLFLPNGGIAGFYCQHAYPHATTLPRVGPLFPSALKGVDLLLHTILVELGLRVTVRPVIPATALDDRNDRRDRYAHVDSDGDSEDGVDDEAMIVGHGGLAVTDARSWDGFETEEILREFGSRKRVFWINSAGAGTGQIGFVHGTYGNQAGVDTMYTHAAFLVTVKPADNRT